MVTENKKGFNWVKFAKIGVTIAGSLLSGLAVFLGINAMLDKASAPIKDPSDPEKVVVPDLKVKDVLNVSMKSAGDTCNKLSTMMGAANTLFMTVNSMFGNESVPNYNMPRTDCYDPNGCFYAANQGFPVFGNYNQQPVGCRYWDNNAYRPNNYTYYPNGGYSYNIGNGSVYVTGNPFAK